MRFKKRFTAILTAAVLTLASAGCGQNGDEAQTGGEKFVPRLDAEEQTTLNIIGNMNNFESLEAVITDFEEYYPNCEVLYEPVTNSGDYWSLLDLRLTSDDSVGIFMMDAKKYNSDLMEEVCADLLEEDIDLSAIQSEVISSATVDGKLYEIPLAHSASGLIVNKNILSENGLELPENYAEFLNACEKLKQAGYVPVQGYAPMVDDQFLRAMSYVLMDKAFGGDSQASLEELETGAEGSAEALRPVFDVLDTMYKNGYMDREVNETYGDNYNLSILEFFEGDVPFLVGTTETLSGMKKRESKSEHFSEEPFEYVYMTTPLGEDGAYCYLENWLGFSVNNNCANREWAVEFMRFITTKAEINKLAYVKGLPSVAVESDDDRFIGLYDVPEDYRCTIDTFFPTTVKDALYAVELDLANEKITVDEATAELERRLRESDFEQKE